MLSKSNSIADYWIYATDKQTGKLVYELYGLTEEEIKIVEVT
jgi:hypothetical protein